MNFRGLLLVMTAMAMAGAHPHPPSPTFAVAFRASPGQASDSAGLRRSAEEAQARFERLRRRLANPTPGGYRGRCDVTVGRMCLRFGSGSDWWPEPDPPELTEARDSLLVRLARIAGEIPGDGWVSGQRVAYLAEVHRLDAALEVAEGCAFPGPGWCPGLRGFVLHRQGRFSDAAKAFEVMLGEMAAAGDTLRVREWTDPAVLLDGRGREVAARLGPARVWRWADPLFMVPGNDRWTEHMARQVTNAIRREAENPYHLAWGDDLAEMLVRYGWEYGWERVDPSPAMMTTTSTILGQEHPEARSFMPPSRALSSVEASSADDWNPGGRTEPRTGYAPAYAPVFLPARGDLYRFPRGDSLVLVAWLALPEDTSFHAGHDHPPLRESPGWRGRPPALGLFADPVKPGDGEGTPGGDVPGTTAWAPDPGGPVPLAATRTGVLRGALRLALPPGRYLISAEAWAPDSARAGRIRRGLAWEGVPPDVPTLSDLLVLDDPAGGSRSGVGAAAVRDLPSSLAGALPLIRGEALEPGMTVAVAWELNGIGGEPGPVNYRLEVRPTGGGFLRRAGRWLGVVDGGAAVELGWAEPAPARSGPTLRTTRLVLPPDLAPGRYRLRLRAALAGREALERSVEVEVVDPSR